MISGGNSSCSASSRVATMSGAWTVKGVVEVADVIDVRAVVRIVARLGLEPAVEDLAEHRLRGGAKAERQHIGVVPRARPATRLGVAAEGRAHAGDLVRRDRRARPGPAA